MLRRPGKRPIRKGSETCNNHVPPIRASSRAGIGGRAHVAGVYWSVYELESERENMSNREAISSPLLSVGMLVAALPCKIAVPPGKKSIKAMLRSAGNRSEIGLSSRCELRGGSA